MSNDGSPLFRSLQARWARFAGLLRLNGGAELQRRLNPAPPRALAVILSSAISIACAQDLTPGQKEADFRYLAGLYSTYYAPLDWKKQLFHFDALAIQPWLERAAATRTDLDFYELCVEYVANLNDTHDHFTLPSDFSATLGFTTDVFDGVLLIESVNRTLLPASQYPFTIGDELLSIDGADVQRILPAFEKYVAYGNPIAARRVAAARLTTRPQSRMPHASELAGTAATVVIRRQNGNLETHNIPWTTSGTPLEVGRVPSPRAREPQGRVFEPADPGYLRDLREAQWSGVLDPEDGVSGYGSRNPIFVNALASASFTRRLGGSASDFYYSGTFKYDELTIGYIRIPTYSPPSTAVALAQFEQEIAYMTANTDGLIVDEMRNTGGNLCFGEEIAVRLIPYPFRATGFQLRPFWSRINSFYSSLVAARSNGASQQIIDQYELVFNALVAANQQGRMVTESLPLCTSSLMREGHPAAYQKPLMMLIDEFSTSTADSVPGMLKDANRAVLYGMRTDGAGGNNTTFSAGPYTEGSAGMTLALQTRKNKVSEPGYPFTEYIENVGVWPDIPADYMTRANLLQNGAPFVSGFLQHMAAEIRARR